MVLVVQARVKSIEYVKAEIAKIGLISIIEETYVAFKRKATFLHEGYGEFEATPRQVIVYGRRHPTYMKQQRVKKFKEKIKSGESKSLKKGSLEAIERMKKVRSHSKLSPREKAILSKKHFKEKYGVDNPYQLDSVKEKIKNTNLERYGETNPLKVKEIKEKVISTHVERYGAIGLASDVIKSKVLDTLSKEGIVNVSQREETKKTIKQNNLKKYGVEFYSQTEESKNRVYETYLKNNPTKLINGRTQADIAKEYNAPLSSLNKLFNDGELTEEILNAFKERHRGSLLERRVSHMLDVEFFNKKTTSSGRRADFKINDCTYLNIDGTYWHSYPNRDKDYHFRLRKEYEAENLRLLQFYESELDTKINIIKSMVNNINGLSNRVYARKTEIRPVIHKDASLFLEENHLMGTFNGKHVGLYDDKNILVCLVTFSIKKGILNIDRFSNKNGVTVVGGFSKIFNFLKKSNTFDAVYFWVDLRYGSGEWLKKLGFHFKRDVLSFKWIDKNTNKTFNRLRIRAADNLTQVEVAKKQGIYKMYDAGQRLFAYEDTITQ